MAVSSPATLTPRWAARYARIKALCARGHYRKAVKRAQTNWQRCVQQHGAMHVETIEAANQLAVALRYAGQYQTAADWSRQVVVDATQVYGARMPTWYANHLGVLMTVLGEYASAAAVFEQLLAVDAGDRAPRVNLAVVETARGSYDKAMRLMQQAAWGYATAYHSQWERVLRGRPILRLEAARLQLRLAELLHWQGYQDNAVASLFDQAVEALSTLLGASHPLVGEALTSWAEHNYIEATLFHSASLPDRERKREQAEQAARYALLLLKRRMGPAHPLTARSRSCFGEILGFAWAREEARAYLEDALRVQTVSLGMEHPDSLKTRSALCELAYREGHTDQAIFEMEQCLAGRERRLGPHHLLTGETCHNLGYFLAAQERFTEAERFFTRAVSIHEKISDGRHPYFAIALHHLAGAREALGKSAVKLRKQEHLVKAAPLRLQQPAAFASLLEPPT